MTNRMGQPSRGTAHRVVYLAVLALLSLCLPGAASAQWTTPDAAGNISTTNTGNVGVGTAAPTSRLEVRGTTSDANGSAFGVSNSSGQGLFAVRNDGYASIFFLAGTRGGLSISGDGIQGVYSDFIMRPATSTGIATGKPLRFGFSLMKNNPTYGGDATGPSFVLSATIQGGGIYVPLIVNPNGNLILAGAANATNGNVGVGTNAPAAKFHVAGDIRVDGNINAKYQDVAEWVPSTQRLAAGTVVVLDPERPNHVLASNSPYDTAVAGVISERPGLTLGEAGAGKALVATTGRVKVRVDATRAPIRIGDLLVTSDTAGVAMKSVPVGLGDTQIHRPGTIIGKALEPLAGGTREILVLLSLQ